MANTRKKIIAGLALLWPIAFFVTCASVPFELLPEKTAGYIVTSLFFSVPIIIYQWIKATALQGEDNIPKVSITQAKTRQKEKHQLTTGEIIDEVEDEEDEEDEANPENIKKQMKKLKAAQKLVEQWEKANPFKQSKPKEQIPKSPEELQKEEEARKKKFNAQLNQFLSACGNNLLKNKKISQKRGELQVKTDYATLHGQIPPVQRKDSDTKKSESILSPKFLQRNPSRTNTLGRSPSLAELAVASQVFDEQQKEAIKNYISESPQLSNKNSPHRVTSRMQDVDNLFNEPELNENAAGIEGKSKELDIDFSAKDKLQKEEENPPSKKKFVSIFGGTPRENNEDEDFKFETVQFKKTPGSYSGLTRNLNTTSSYKPEVSIFRKLDEGSIFNSSRMNKYVG